MKEFLSLVRKECRHIFRDKRTILIVMIMPVVQIILFGFAVSTEVTRARVAFCGDMSDTRVREAVERIENNRYLEYAGQLPDPDGIEELFRRNGADAVVCFSRNFGRSLPSGGGRDKNHRRRVRPEHGENHHELCGWGHTAGAAGCQHRDERESAAVHDPGGPAYVQSRDEVVV